MEGCNWYENTVSRYLWHLLPCLMHFVVSFRKITSWTLMKIWFSSQKLINVEKFITWTLHNASLKKNRQPYLTKTKQKQKKNNSLIVLNQLVETEQDAEPPCTVVWLQIEAYLVHNGCPLARIVMLDHVVDACCQLDPEEFRAKGEKNNDERPSKVGGQISRARLALSSYWGKLALPDAVGWVDDGLHYVVSNELPVFLRDVIDGCLGAWAVSLAPVLGYHVLKVNDTYDRKNKTQTMRWPYWNKKAHKMHFNDYYINHASWKKRRSHTLF